MSETQAASSPAEVDVFEGRTEIGVGEYIRSRQPAENKPADNATTAPADAQEQTASEGDKPESSGEPDTPTDSQEKAQPKKLNADGRAAQIDRLIEAELEKPNPDPDKIANLQKTRDRVLGGAEAKRKTEFAPVTPPQTQPSQQQANQAQLGRQKPIMTDVNPDGTFKYAGDNALEMWVEDVADWKAEQRIARHQFEQQVKAKTEALRQQYGEEFDSVLDPTAGAIKVNPAIPDEVKTMIAYSGVAGDLLKKLGTDPKAMEMLVSCSLQHPLWAANYIGQLEADIRRNSASQALDAPARNDKGQFVADEPPAQKKTTAPKPPSPVTGGSSRAFDVSDESLSSDEWMRKRNKQLGKG